MGAKSSAYFRRVAPGAILSAFFAVMAVMPCAAEIEWLAKEYDFGAFKEADGPVTGSVKFINRGHEATFISRVRPSCGCTGASYTTSMIEPGDTATVSFTYNPLGRPGAFDKTVKVYVGEDNELTTLRITGTVIGSAATLENNYPVEAGPIRVENTLIPAGELKRGSSRHLFLNIYNQSDKPVSPLWEPNDKALQVALVPATVPPGDVATFSLYMRTVDEPKNGPFEYSVIIYPDGKSSDPLTVTVAGVIVPDTRHLSLEQIDNAPQAFLLPEFVDFGETGVTGDIDFEFSILNDGKSDLNVDRVYCRAGGVKINRIPSKVKPGKTEPVKGKLQLSKLPSGPFRLKVDVVTDDPLHPVRTCNLVGIKL